MGWWIFRRRQRWAGVDFTRLVPEKLVTAEKDPDTGLYVLQQPRFARGLLGRWVQPRLPERRRYVRIPLEERGSLLWEHMDGRRSVADLTQKLLETMPEENEQIYDRVSAYIYQLACNGLVGFRNLG